MSIFKWFVVWTFWQLYIIRKISYLIFIKAKLAQEQLRYASGNL